MKVSILGVKIDDVNMDEALSQIEQWVKNPGPDSRQSRNRGSSTNEIRREKHYVVTPNPEIIMAAQKDQLLKKILNDADLSIPDGAGLKLSGKIKNITPGIDLMESLVKLSAEKGFATGFLGGREGVAEKVTECLIRKYPDLQIAFAGSGGEVDVKGNVLSSKYYGKENNKPLIHNTNPILPCDLLFVAFGHIKQEKWIADNLDKVPAHVIMAVGGAFDFLSGNVPRAPKQLRSIGLEWLFRLLVQPWRIKRQLALIKYMWLLVRQ